MKKVLASALALIITGTPIASAQNAVSLEETFDSIFNALLTPANGPDAKWEAVNNIKGVNWKWPLNQKNQHNYTMEGTVGDYIDVKISSSGYYDVEEFQEPPFIGSASISFGLNIETFEETKYIDINHFNPDQLTKIPTTCDVNDGMYEEAFYKWVKPGYTPLYIQYISSFGTRMGNIDYKINSVPDDLSSGQCQFLQ